MYFIPTFSSLRYEMGKQMKVLLVIMVYDVVVVVVVVGMTKWVIKPKRKS